MIATRTRILTGHVNDGCVRLACRRGAADDLTYYRCREGEPDFTPLDADDEEIIDNLPKLDPARPEVRRYYAMLLYSGEENRLKSNEVVLTIP
jgi:hypothetical protein